MKVVLAPLLLSFDYKLVDANGSPVYKVPAINHNDYQQVNFRLGVGINKLFTDISSSYSLALTPMKRRSCNTLVRIDAMIVGPHFSATCILYIHHYTICIFVI
jgi:hypothetical protein